MTFRKTKQARHLIKSGYHLEDTGLTAEQGKGIARRFRERGHRAQVVPMATSFGIRFYVYVKKVYLPQSRPKRIPRDQKFI